MSPVATINRPGGLTDGIDQWTADWSKLLAESSNRGPDAVFSEWHVKKGLLAPD